MTDQLTTETTTYAMRPAVAPAPHWARHPAREFPHRIGDHEPNLATLAQLRSGGRNPLLLPGSRRRRVQPKGCTGR